ncbi:PREDICTED: cytosolic sulfotransferase 16-like [Nicotiana attenuata]|uniref:Sulfotransferase n=1 Tax=Nicotiana attenuata TaxID=49451 RepID=A0A1J6KAI8_NICAT|nr:PREDICTED: cytosolic sulfotransferase 16-like [Nicotiana attenuata]OIT21992.1 cytosolic sulfotransferase 16 [Nicotiana attenuata]
MQENFKAQPSDIFLCSYPKTGTTWLKALTFSIMIRDRFSDDDSTNPLLTKQPHECVRTVEVDSFTNPTLVEAEFPLLATHLPYSCLAPSILESDCKIIYICREPKDTFVSWWHYMQKVKESADAFKAEAVPFEQEFKWFCEGKSSCGPYWNHVLDYWKGSSVDRPERVFFLTYEDLKSNTLCYVKKLAEFMGKPFSTEEENQGVAEKIVARCHFESLSNLEVNKSGCIHPNTLRVKNSAFFRKGEIGDWKNLLTEDMAKSVDHITQEKFQSLGLTWIPVSTNECKNNAKD